MSSGTGIEMILLLKNLQLSIWFCSFVYNRTANHFTDVVSLRCSCQELLPLLRLVGTGEWRPLLLHDFAKCSDVSIAACKPLSCLFHMWGERLVIILCVFQRSGKRKDTVSSLFELVRNRLLLWRSRHLTWPWPLRGYCKILSWSPHENKDTGIYFKA